MSPPKPPLRPQQWLIYSPLVILPLLAALFIERPVEGRTAKGFSLADYELLLQHHWFWLVVALGLGVWVGWYTAIDRAPSQVGEENEPEKTQGKAEAP
jgi:hypothetical protein